MDSTDSPTAHSAGPSALGARTAGLYRSEFSRQHILRLSGASGQVLADHLEEALTNFYVTGRSPERPLLIDFSPATYLDIAALLNLTSAFVYRKERGWPTYIGIPVHKPVRDFLRVWRYPENFFEATGVPFESVLPLDDAKYRGESQTTYTGLGGDIDSIEFDRDWREGYPTRRNFFECCTYRVSGDGWAATGALKPTSIPRLEGSRWNDPLIRAVLSKHLAIDARDTSSDLGVLRPESDDIARVAVYESLSNAVRHPKATVIQAISKFDHKGSPDLGLPTDDSSSASGESTSETGHLRICVWDDGMSIVDTLLPLVRAGRPIRALRLPEFMYDRIHVLVRDFNETKIREYDVTMAADLHADAEQHDILLASLFPGVSRAVAEHVEDVEPFGASSDRTAMRDAQGLGLYALTRTVIDSYQGVLFCRTGRLRLLLEAAHDAYRKLHSVRYKAKITLYPEAAPAFRGNLVVVHFPVRRYSPSLQALTLGAE